jgi:hypothetical protein
MQCACAILPSVACPPLQYFSTFSHKLHDFREKNVIGLAICTLVLSTTFISSISHSKKNWARYDKKVDWSSSKVPLFLSDFNETWIFFGIFSKTTKQFHENPSGGSRVISCGRADVKKLIVTFQKCTNAPKNWTRVIIKYSFRTAQ